MITNRNYANKETLCVFYHRLVQYTEEYNLVLLYKEQQLTKYV